MAVYPRRLNTYFRGFLAGRLAAELTEQERLLRNVRAALPAALASQCRYCLKKRGQLLIHVESSAAATLLRFHGTELLGRIANEQGLHFTRLVIRNLATPSDDAEKNPLALSTGPDVQAHLVATAEDCTHDEIRSSLFRLARTLDRKKKARHTP